MSTGEGTLEGTVAFEGFACSLNVWVQHNHADKRRLCKNLWMKNINNENQTISFWAVNAHFQNRVAEHQIRDLSDRSTTSLFHAEERGRKAISDHLWPYVVRHGNDVCNTKPIELFCLQISPD
jgi:hypothetical protein